jgi:hypothetical protein
MNGRAGAPEPALSGMRSPAVNLIDLNPYYLYNVCIFRLVS